MAKTEANKIYFFGNITHAFIIAFLAVFLLTSYAKTASAASNVYSSITKTHKVYVKTACNSTTYPETCYKALSSHATAIKSDPIRLCTTALTVTMRSARVAASSISKIARQQRREETAGTARPETQILKDCIEEIQDSIEELKEAIEEMKKIGGRNATGGGGSMEDVKTWVSAALTDEDTCTDGFEGMKVKESVKKKVKEVIADLSRMTSFTLALITDLPY